MTKSYQPVYFENSLGEKISNDPVFKAQQTLLAAGVGFADSQPLAAQDQLKRAAAQDDDSLPDNDDDDTPPTDGDGFRTYEELDGRQLKAEAKTREVDISGLKKVGEVRAKLIEADKAAAKSEQE